jgi:hypothetical protein
VDAIRRENESKLQPIKLQEEELSDELARQKERDALRKSYIEEMKLRHEQTKAELLQQLSREQMLHKEDQAARSTCEAQLQTMDAELHDVRKLEADRRERDNQVAACCDARCCARDSRSRAVLSSPRSAAQAGSSQPMCRPQRHVTCCAGGGPGGSRGGCAQGHGGARR